jgi:hypothetical protein
LGPLRLQTLYIPNTTLSTAAPLSAPSDALLRRRVQGTLSVDITVYLPRNILGTLGLDCLDYYPTYSIEEKRERRERPPLTASSKEGERESVCICQDSHRLSATPRSQHYTLHTTTQYTLTTILHTHLPPPLLHHKILSFCFCPFIPQALLRHPAIIIPTIPKGTDLGPFSLHPTRNYNLEPRAEHRGFNTSFGHGSVSV